MEALISSTSTTFTRTAEDFEFRVTEVSKNIDNVAQDMDAKFEVISKYIRFFDEDGHVVIGLDGNTLTLAVTIFCS